MGLFDNRTDTEKELENYHQQNNGNSSNRRKSPFDIPNGYTQNNNPMNYTENNFNQPNGNMQYNSNNYINQEKPQNNFNQPNGNMRYNSNNYINQEKPQNNFNQPNGNMQYNSNNYINQPNANIPYYNRQQKTANKMPVSNIGGCVLISWFLASIIAIVVLAEISTEWVMIVFGQMFLIFGLFAMFAGKFDSSKIWIIIFPLIGLGCIGGALISLYGTEELKEQFYDILPMLGLGLFWIIGLGLIVLPIYTRKVKEKRCTLPVQGIIADLNRRWSRGSNGRRGHYVYAPVYEYFYNGVLYRQESNTYTNYENFEIGTEVTVFLNPSDPNDYYVKRSQTVTVILGIMFLVMASACIAVYVLTGG